MPMAVVEETKLWHPFADMGHVRNAELMIERGDDVWVWDTDGNRYLDGTAALWYANVGHGRKEIAEAVAAQMGKLEAYSAFGDFGNLPARELAATLCDLAPMPSRVFLGSGGGDGIDTAAKLARRYWHERGQPDRTLLISRTAGYHGTHGFGTALAGIPANRIGFGPQVHTVQVPHDSLEAAEAAIMEAGPERVAAIFVEPVIGAGGLYPPVPGYIEGLHALCMRTGILFVCDSVICGFGRLGTWFGIERWGVQPDMIVFAKGVTSGYLPLGGVVVSDEIAAPFWSEPGGPIFRHGPTYSAHATCCAAAIANIKLLSKDGLVERARELEQPLFDALHQFAGRPEVGEVRGGIGVLGGIELAPDVLDSDPGAVGKVAVAARARGVLIRPLGRGVAVSPPLTLQEDHIAQIADAIDHGLSAL